MIAEEVLIKKKEGIRFIQRFQQYNNYIYIYLV